MGKRADWSPWRLVQLFVWSAALADCAPVHGQRFKSSDVDTNNPIRVCTASIEDFGARCNGAPVPEWEGGVKPRGTVPRAGWCTEGRDFCGYDLDVWTHVAKSLNLVQGEHYVHVCMGELGFGPMIDDLAREDFSNPSNETDSQSSYHPMDRYLCDIGASSITANTERWRRGIWFSRATLRSNLAIMVHAPLLKKGKWAFFSPISASVWFMLGMTVLIVPFLVFFAEAIFSKHCVYLNKDGKLDVWFGIKEALWHGIAEALSIDVFRVTTAPGRIIVAAYAFIVMIITHTYTANLAAFLTVNQLDTSITSVNDLHGKVVATLPTYTNRLYANHQIVTSSTDGWDHDSMERKLLEGKVSAIISDSTQLVSHVSKDENCHLHLLQERIEPFDLALAFAKGFAYPGLITAVDALIVQLQENGDLSRLEEQNSYPPPKCQEEREFEETNQVSLSSLIGLWYIMAGFTAFAFVAGSWEYCVWWRRRPQKTRAVRQRAATLSRSLLSGPSSFLRTMMQSRSGSMLRSHSHISGPPPGTGKGGSFDAAAAWDDLLGTSSSVGSEALPTFRNASFLRQEGSLPCPSLPKSSSSGLPPSNSGIPARGDSHAAASTPGSPAIPIGSAVRVRAPCIPAEALPPAVSGSEVTAATTGLPTGAADAAVEGRSGVLPPIATVVQHPAGCERNRRPAGTAGRQPSTVPQPRNVANGGKDSEGVESARSPVGGGGGGGASEGPCAELQSTKYGKLCVVEADSKVGGAGGAARRGCEHRAELEAAREACAATRCSSAEAQGRPRAAVGPDGDAGDAYVNSPSTPAQASPKAARHPQPHAFRAAAAHAELEPDPAPAEGPLAALQALVGTVKVPDEQVDGEVAQGVMGKSGGYDMDDTVREELLQLSGIVHALASHLDAMIAETESSAAAGSEQSRSGSGSNCDSAPLQPLQRPAEE